MPRRPRPTRKLRRRLKRPLPPRLLLKPRRKRLQAPRPRRSLPPLPLLQLRRRQQRLQPLQRQLWQPRQNLRQPRKLPTQARLKAPRHSARMAPTATPRVTAAHAHAMAAWTSGLTNNRSSLAVKPSPPHGGLFFPKAGEPIAVSMAVSAEGLVLLRICGQVSELKVCRPLWPMP